MLGFERMEYELTADAIALGLDGALPATFDLGDQIGEFGRGERDCPSKTQRSPRFLMVNATRGWSIPRRETPPWSRWCATPAAS